MGILEVFKVSDGCWMVWKNVVFGVGAGLNMEVGKENCLWFGEVVFCTESNGLVMIISEFEIKGMKSDRIWWKNLRGRSCRS